MKLKLLSLITGLTLCLTTQVSAVEVGGVIKLTDESRFMLKVPVDIAVVKQLDTLKGGVKVWAVQPSPDDGKFHQLRIIYTLSDGRIVVGDIFDKAMKSSTIKYAKALQKEVESQMLKLDDSLKINIGKLNSEHQWPILVIASDDNWLGLVSRLNSIVTSSPFFNMVGYNVYFKPSGDSRHPSNSALTWKSRGGAYLAELALSGKEVTSQLAQAAAEASPKAKVSLVEPIAFANKLAGDLAVSNLGVTAVYNQRKLVFTNETTDDEIKEFLAGAKVDNL